MGPVDENMSCRKAQIILLVGLVLVLGQVVHGQGLGGGLAGGYAEIELNSTELRQPTQAATQNFHDYVFTRTTGDGPQHCATGALEYGLVKAEQQVVAGHNYKLTLQLTTTCNGKKEAFICKPVVYVRFDCEEVACMEVTNDVECLTFN